MIDRVLLLSLTGSTLLSALVLLEWWDTGQPGKYDPVTPVSVAEERIQLRVQTPRIEELVAATLERPLFTTTRRPPDRASANPASSPELPDLRLAGVLIDSDHHIAIFAIPGAKPLVRAQGESVNEWRLDAITPREVTLIGPTGSTTLEPKTDPNIVRSAQPSPQSQPQPQLQPQAMRAASAAGQPIGVANRPPFPVPGAAPPRPPSIPIPRPPGPVRAPNPPRPPQ